MSIIGQSLGAQARIVFTVAARDAKVKHRESPIGIFSAILEPLATISIMSLIFAYVRLRLPVLGDYMILFIASGAIPVSMFRGTAIGAEQAFRRMSRLLTMPQLRPLDILIGGLVSNFLALLALYVAIIAFFKLIYQVPEPQNFTLTMIPLVCNALIGLGISCVNMTIKSWFPFWGKLFGILTGPLNMLSGLFYTANSMPLQVQKYMYYNPFLHSTELCRTFFFKEYTSELFDPVYYGGWVIGSLCVGFACERIFRYRLQAVKN